jgi:hypothetical protein
VSWQVRPRHRISLITDSEDGLDSNVHDHEALCPKAEWQNLQSVCDEEA